MFIRSGEPQDHGNCVVNGNLRTSEDEIDARGTS